MPPNPGRPSLDWSDRAPFPFTRESSIRLDAEGRFWHEGALVAHPGLAQAMHGWISRHPDNQRWVLENGYDWCYLTVDDAPVVVRAARLDGGGTSARVVLTLSDGSEDRVDPAALRVDAEGVLRCDVKAGKKGGPFPARFDRHAIQSLGQHIREQAGGYVLQVGSKSIKLPRS